MELAAALDGAPAPIGATSLDPYGQLVKMLLPRSQSIAIYDRMGVRVWLNDGVDSPELQRIMQDALGQELGDSSAGEGFAESVDRDHCAYVFLLPDSGAQLIRAVGILCRESRHGSDPRPFPLGQGLLQPAHECQRRELAAQYSIVDLQRNLVVRDRDLELLLGAALEAARPRDQPDGVGPADGTAGPVTGRPGRGYAGRWRARAGHDAARFEPAGRGLLYRNCHKWLCAPKGAGFLHVRRDRRQAIRPLVISHGANSPRTDRSRFLIEFGLMGTCDSAWLSVPKAIEFMNSLLPGGWPETMRRNRKLALAARKIICQALKIPRPCPDELIGSLAAFPLPDSPDKTPPTSPLYLDPLQDQFLHELVDSLHDGIGIKHTSGVRARAHGNHPARLSICSYSCLMTGATFRNTVPDTTNT